MLKKLGGVAGLISMVCLSGCIDATTVVKVNKDGSGVIIEAVYMGRGAQQMMEQMTSQMAASMGGQTGAPPASAQTKPAKSPLEIEKYMKKAATMGEGVTYVSAKEVKKDDGSTGVQVVYKFADITKVKIDSEPDVGMQAGGVMAGMTPEPAPQAKKSPITFEMTTGAKPKLTIHLEKQEPAKAAKVEPPAGAPPAADMKPDPAQMAMMKQMFDGFRMRVAVAVDGNITRSNATYQEKDAAGNSHIVTLVDMNIGKLLGDEATAKKLSAMGDIQDMALAKEKLKGIEGLKIETNEKVEIEFE